jgi:hypothetical protein
LNGAEIFRNNLPQGPLTYATPAISEGVDDGQFYFASPVDPTLLRGGENTLAVEVHQAAGGGDDLSFALALEANVDFQRPSVAITSPTNRASIGSASIPIETQVMDPDGVVSMVTFFANGVEAGTVITPPFSFVYSNVSAGSYVLQAVARDNTGLTSTSAPVNVTVPPRLVPSGALWKYLDDGTDPGPSWTAPAFDDSRWSNGLAQLGLGEGDVATFLQGIGTVTGSNIVTYYFRHGFDLSSTAGISNLVLRLVRDDGAVVYLNQSEVFRINMAPGPTSASSFARQVVSSDRTFHAIRVNPALLHPGRNVLAVEMHQFNLTSSDMSFDLELRPNLPPTPPVVALVSPGEGTLFGPTNITLAALASDFDDPIVSVAFFMDNNRRGTDTTDSYEIDGRNFSLDVGDVDAGRYVLRAVATDNSGLSTTSAPVSLTVAYAPVLTTLITTGSVWKYLDTGVDQGTAWRAALFDDRSWKSGRAKFGTNDPAITIIDLTPVNVNITTYFRHRFSVNGAAGYTNLSFRVLRDDGVVVYLNGVELFRSNMPSGLIEFSSWASLGIGGTNESFYLPVSTPADALMNGENVLAVELHQVQSVTTLDAGFDLGLVGIALPAAIAPAIDIRITPTGAMLSWQGAGFTLQDSSAAIGPYTNRVLGTNAYVLPNPIGSRFFRLIKP